MPYIFFVGHTKLAQSIALLKLYHFQCFMKKKNVNYYFWSNIVHLIATTCKKTNIFFVLSTKTTRQDKGFFL